MSTLPEPKIKLGSRKYCLARAVHGDLIISLVHIFFFDIVAEQCETAPSVCAKTQLRQNPNFSYPLKNVPCRGRTRVIRAIPLLHPYVSFWPIRRARRGRAFIVAESQLARDFSSPLENSPSRGRTKRSVDPLSSLTYRYLVYSKSSTRPRPRLALNLNLHGPEILASFFKMQFVRGRTRRFRHPFASPIYSSLAYSKGPKRARPPLVQNPNLSGNQYLSLPREYSRDCTRRFGHSFISSIYSFWGTRGPDKGAPSVGVESQLAQKFSHAL